MSKDSTVSYILGIATTALAAFVAKAANRRPAPEKAPTSLDLAMAEAIDEIRRRGELLRELEIRTAKRLILNPEELSQMIKLLETDNKPS